MVQVEVAGQPVGHIGREAHVGRCQFTQQPVVRRRCLLSVVGLFMVAQQGLAHRAPPFCEHRSRNEAFAFGLYVNRSGSPAGVAQLAQLAFDSRTLRRAGFLMRLVEV